MHEHGRVAQRATRRFPPRSCVFHLLREPSCTIDLRNNVSACTADLRKLKFQMMKSSHFAALCALFLRFEFDRGACVREIRGKSCGFTCCGCQVCLKKLLKHLMLDVGTLSGFISQTHGASAFLGPPRAWCRSPNSSATCRGRSSTPAPIRDAPRKRHKPRRAGRKCKFASWPKNREKSAPEMRCAARARSPSNAPAMRDSMGTTRGTTAASLSPARLHARPLKPRAHERRVPLLPGGDFFCLAFRKAVLDNFDNHGRLERLPSNCHGWNYKRNINRKISNATPV